MCFVFSVLNVASLSVTYLLYLNCLWVGYALRIIY